ncbi:MAG: ribbon-helix-helix domain-containing protein [Candidatus Methanomethyliaceae archaeon]|nr:ribbon-helix-helix domain-containing protein [Candidatus Methanomethyliaceae archaeon]
MELEESNCIARSKGWKAFYVPKEYVEVIEKIVNETNRYRGINEFVRDAVMDKLKELGYPTKRYALPSEQLI